MNKVTLIVNFFDGSKLMVHENDKDLFRAIVRTMTDVEIYLTDNEK